MIRKVVIPAAGLGTRLTPATKEQPKEMLPMFTSEGGSGLYLTPFLQLVFEQLYRAGLSEFCFVVGRGKRAIEDHFTPDRAYFEMLSEKGKSEEASRLQDFYNKVGSSTIVWVNQPSPIGFGDAVLKAKSFVGKEKFLVHAGDNYICSETDGHLSRLAKVEEELGADAVFLLTEIQDPKHHGIIEGERVDDGVFRVLRAVEKPSKPFSNLAIVPVYLFGPDIFEALARTCPGVDGEIQLTDAIQILINLERKVYAIPLMKGEVRLDIGSAETYWEALRNFYRYKTLMRANMKPLSEEIGEH